MKSALRVCLCSLLLTGLLCACGAEPAAAPASSSAPVQPQTAGSALAALYDTLTEAAGEPPRTFELADYDGDGKQEAFACVGEAAPGDYGILGLPWFVSEKGANPLFDPSERPEQHYLPPVFYDMKGTRVVCIEDLMAGTVTSSRLYAVRDGAAYELALSGKTMAFLRESDGFTAIGNAYDAGCLDPIESPGILSGHTYKRYWFYWDAALQELCEYGGIEITAAALRAHKDAGAILDALAADGQEITSILYRANGIVNINCTKEWTNTYRTLLLDGLSVTDVTGRYPEGIYQPAYSENATYPEAFPAP